MTSDVALRGIGDLSPAERAEVVRLAETMSAAQIATKFGLRSRNVVIGYWHRARAAVARETGVEPEPRVRKGKADKRRCELPKLPLPVRKSKPGPRPGTNTHNAPQAAPVVVPKIRDLLKGKVVERGTSLTYTARQMTATGSPSPSATLALGPRDCRWPVGDGYCCARRHPDAPYCETHVRLAYDPVAQPLTERRVKWLSAEACVAAN